MSKKLDQAVKGLHKEIAKLDPKAQAAINKHLKTIHGEFKKAASGALELADPIWD